MLALARERRNGDSRWCDLIHSPAHTAYRTTAHMQNRARGTWRRRAGRPATFRSMPVRWVITVTAHSAYRRRGSTRDFAVRFSYDARTKELALDDECRDRDGAAG